MDLHHGLHGEYPIFLIDDVDSELDDERMNRVVELLRQKDSNLYDNQSTGSNLPGEHSHTAQRFHLEAGAVTEVGNSTNSQPPTRIGNIRMKEGTREEKQNRNPNRNCSGRVVRAT
jgi:hypothetical protein